jgi:hypothetical protein
MRIFLKHGTRILLRNHTYLRSIFDRNKYCLILYEQPPCPLKGQGCVPLIVGDDILHRTAQLPPALLISSAATFWASMHGLVPGESTVQTYPMTMGSPVSAAVDTAGDKAKNSSNSDAKATILNLD